MSETYHDEHLLDRAAMLAMRGMLALQPKLQFLPEVRETYDGIIERTPPFEGVTFEQTKVGGVPGWWCHPPRVVAGRSVLYLHGGGYVMGSATAYRNFVSQIAGRTHAAVFIADYRLAPEYPFPAAVDDAAAAYDGLVEGGYKSIALVGDSAGGGLALNLLREVTKNSSTGKPKPVAAVLMSPWVDLSQSGESFESRSKHDPLLSKESLGGAASLYAGSTSRSDVRLSPLNGDLADLPPILVHVGEDEVLLDDSSRLHARAQASGTDVALHVWQGMTHVFPSGVSMLRAAPEALDITGEYLRTAFAAL